MGDEERKLVEAFKRLFATDDGELVLKDLRESFYEIHTLDPDKTDAAGVNKATWLAGCRWVVGYILGQIEYEDPPEEVDNPDSHRGHYL